VAILFILFFIFELVRPSMFGLRTLTPLLAEACYC